MSCLARGALTWLACLGLVAVIVAAGMHGIASAQPVSRVLSLPDRDGVPGHNVRVLLWEGQGVASRPMVVYEPGWNGSADENSILLASLAAHGFDVVALDIPAAQPPAFATTAARLRLPLDLSTSAALERSVAEADWRVTVLADDAIASLERIAETAKAPALGVLGYSFGGAVAGELCRRDRRFLACLNMDGWQFGPAATNPGSQPNMLLSGEPYPDRPQPASTPAQVLDQWDAALLRLRMAMVGGLYAQIDGLTHADFTDRAGGDAAVRSLTTAFFLQTLRHQQNPLLALEHPMPSVTLTRFGPSALGPKINH